MKALDIVKTPEGGVAFVKETNRDGKQASIAYIRGMNPEHERSAWWNESELEVVDSIPRMLAIVAAHPFGQGREDVDKFFPVE